MPRWGALLHIGGFEEGSGGALLLLTGNKGVSRELLARNISYMELRGSELTVQMIDGAVIRQKGARGTMRDLLKQMEELRIDCLRQIYRSVIVNIDQIREVRLEKNTGEVLLFHDDEPKPVGMKYRGNISELLPKG